MFHSALPSGYLGVDVAAAVEVLLDIAGAVQYLHSIKLVHGDIKVRSRWLCLPTKLHQLVVLAGASMAFLPFQLEIAATLKSTCYCRPVCRAPPRWSVLPCLLISAVSSKPHINPTPPRPMHMTARERAAEERSFTPPGRDPEARRLWA
jgi:hypothetical protein